MFVRLRRSFVSHGGSEAVTKLDVAQRSACPGGSNGLRSKVRILHALDGAVENWHLRAERNVRSDGDGGASLDDTSWLMKRGEGRGASADRRPEMARERRLVSSRADRAGDRDVRLEKSSAADRRATARTNDARLIFESVEAKARS